jgi:protein-disulfide isomerase
MQAAEAVGVRGTPTIVLQDGKLIPGYVPAGELIPMANAAALN